jgi:hypothetical protein
MKNFRGAALQNVRSAIWHVFGCERLPLLKSNAVVSNIVRWKQSEEVASCYRSLFEQNESGAFWVAVIARSAFSTTAVPTLSDEHCAFTLAVCDILLNPKSKGIICKESKMKRHMERFLVSFIIYTHIKFVSKNIINKFLL